MGKAFLLLSLLAALIHQSHQSCDACHSTFTSSGTDCDAAFAYIGCDDLAQVDTPGCPTDNTRYTELTDVMTLSSCTGKSTMCDCQQSNMQTLAANADPSTRCASHKEKIACIEGLTGAAGTGCNSVTVHGSAAVAFHAIETYVLSGDCTMTGLCVCEKDYAITDISATDDRCTAKKAFIACITGESDSTSCRPSDTVKILADKAAATIATDCGASFTDSLCKCEVDYAQTDISSTPCPPLMTFLECVSGKDGAGCAAASTAKTLTTNVIDSGGFGSCSPNAVCTCQKAYAGADISSSGNKCTAQKALITCLYDKTGTGCAVETPITLGNKVNTDSACTDLAGTACECELAYIREDISTDGNKCTQKKTLLQCIMGKGATCDGGTVQTLANALITEIPGITSCSLPASTCSCEQVYAKADISTEAKHCTALGVFVDCLKKKTNTGCADSTVATIAAIAETNYGTLTSTCAIAGLTCECEVNYIKMAYNTAEDMCNAESYLLSCLKGRSEIGCDEATKSHTLAAAAGSLVVSECTAETTTCTLCEKVYAETDLTSTDKCGALVTYMKCLKLETDNGCITADTVPLLAEAGETAMKALGVACPVTDTCQCEIDYIKATRTSLTDKCSANKALMLCVTEKTEISCDGSDKPSDVASSAKTVIDALGSTCVSGLTETCKCQMTYAMVDQSGGPDCAGRLAFMDCLSKTYDVGCDGTSRNTLATNLDLSTCAPTEVCACQVTYAKVDYTDNTAQCDAIMAGLSCLDGKTGAGCDSGTSLIDVATNLEARVSTDSCTITDTCQCEANDLKADKSDDAKKCTAHKALLSCLMIAMDKKCDKTTERKAFVDALKDTTSTITDCSLNAVCSNCMIDYGKSSTGVVCDDVKKLMVCLEGEDVYAGTGCNEAKTIPTIVDEIETATTCSSGFTEVCKCAITFMKAPGTDTTEKCTALTTYFHCLDGAADDNCDGTEQRDVVASRVDGLIVDAAPLTGTCRTDLTTTCSTCQTNYAKADYVANSHCTQLYTKVGCLAGEPSVACLSTVKPHTLASDTMTRITNLGSCSTSSATCVCQTALAVTDITNEPDYCSAIVAELLCLKDETSLACDESTTRDELDIQAKTTLNTIGTCSPTTTCQCEIDYALINPASDAAKCTAWEQELVCLHGKTPAGCDGASTTEELENAILVKMDSIASPLKCAVSAICNCQIIYAVADKSTTGTHCTALKAYLHCLAGESQTGCNGIDTAQTLATEANTILTTAPFDTECVLSEACICERDHALADLSGGSCTALLGKMECLYSANDDGCIGTARHTLATDTATSVGSCSPSAVCNCMIPYAKVDRSTGLCDGTKILISCLDALSDADHILTSCDSSKTVSDLATAAETASAACPALTSTCECIVTFLKASTTSFCSNYEALIDCLTVTEDATCDGDARNVYGASVFTAYEAVSGGCAEFAAGKVCKDCQEPYISTAPTCSVLEDYFQCIYDIIDGTSCNGRTAKQMIDDQETLYTTTTSCTATTACACQRTYLKSSSTFCTSLPLLIECLWGANDAPCGTSDTLHGSSGTAATAAQYASDKSCTLTDVCQCQAVFAQVNKGDPTELCLGIKAEIQCLEGKVGAGCKSDTSLSDVATNADGLIPVSCTLSETCTCMKDYLIADISGANACPEAEKKISCMYDTTDAACDGTTPRTTIATNFDSVLSTCSPTGSCECQRTYDKATGTDECTYQLAVVTCLQDTTDDGCMTSAGTAVTRTTLGTGVETYIGGATCANESPTCTCQVNFAKATVTPADSLCSALIDLIMCLSGKTDPGCDGSTSAAALAADAKAKISTCSTRDTCDCQIATALVDFTTGDICAALYDEIECIFDAEENGCDIAETRHVVGQGVQTLFTTHTCTAASTVCGTCIEGFATTDISSDICEPLRDFLYCLDGSTGTSCKSTGALDISTLATNANSKLNSNSCGTLTDTCQCQYDHLTRAPTMDPCLAEAKLMECLVASTEVACDGSTTRAAYAAESHTDLQGVTGCEDSLTDTCKTCEIVYAKAASGCPALKDYFHCLDSKTASSCYDSKSVQVLASEADTRAAADACDLGTTCTCQANFLKSTDARCTALKNKMSCLAISFDTACDETTTRDAVATTTGGDIDTDTCSGITDVCTCEREYAVEAFSVPATHCTNLKTAIGCLEGKTNAGCGATATVSSFATSVLAKITELGVGTCPLEDTCRCQVEYLADDISTPQLKCDALEKKQACLYEATTVNGCDGSTSRKDIITSVDDDITGTCTVPNSCRCQINYGEETITTELSNCDALKRMVKCLQTTVDGGCVGTNTATRSELADDLTALATSSGDCSLSDACTCQELYGEADVTTPARCGSQKELIVCLGQANDNGCTGIASHSEASTFISGSIESGCMPAAGTTCNCQFDHAKMDRSTPVKACSAYAALIKCLETSTGLGCTGSESKSTIVSRIRTYMSDGANSCPITATCACQMTHAETVIDTVTGKCNALKTKIVCMKSTNDVACDGTTTKVLEATATDNMLIGVGGTCSVEDTCTCESTYAKTDTSTDTCGPSKTLLNCMMTKTETGCVTSFVNVGNAAAGIIAGVSGTCPLTASCTCQQTFATTDATSDPDRCLAYKQLTICLGLDNDAGCTGISKVSLATTAEGLAKGISSCNTGLTSTCQCQFDYAKTDTSTNSKKCTALHKELTCLFKSSGDSCDASQTKDVLASAVNTASMEGSLSCSAKSAACTCTTQYTTTDISSNINKCNAAKTLLSCMSGVTDKGCDGSQTSTAITAAAETAIQEVNTAGGTCSLTDSCECEVAFGKADSSNPTTYCTAAVAYFACIVSATQVGCAGTSNSVLQTQAQTAIAGISGCELPDTCECQERYRMAIAGDSTQECMFRKNALNCLSTATENSCDGTKTKQQVTDDFKQAVDALTTPSCSLSGTCQCQVAYGRADVSETSLKCSAAQEFKTCIINVENDQEIGCDEVTQNQHVLAGPVALAMQTCRGCSLPRISLFACLLLMTVALFFK